MATRPISVKKLSEELDHLYAFGRIYYAAFKFTRNRLKQWYLCTILFDKEVDWAVDEATLRRDDRVEELIEHSAAKYYRIRSLLKSFGNDEGPFLTLSRENSKRIYRLNDHFGAAVDIYVTLFLRSELVSGLPTLELTIEQRRALIKEIYKFQFESYFPAWKTFLNCICVLAAKNGADQRKLMKQFESNGVSTALIVVFWQMFVRDADKNTPIHELPRIISSIMGGWHPTDIPKALGILSGKRGGRIIIKERDGNQWRYRFNESFSDCIISYCTELRRLRLEFTEAIRTHLNQDQ